jgi:copper chaperone CopZ
MRNARTLAVVIPWWGMEDDVSGTWTFAVPGMSCEHCERAVRGELLGVAGVESVEVDLATKAIVVTGEALSERALRAAIEDAGYEAV